MILVILLIFFKYGSLTTVHVSTVAANKLEFTMIELMLFIMGKP